MSEQTQLSMWTVYDHPSDFPNDYVARRWLVHTLGPEPTGDVLRSSSLQTLRVALGMRGLHVIPRSAEDDPIVVETWL